MYMFFADQQIDAGNGKHNDKQQDSSSGSIGRIAAGIAVKHIVDIADNRVHPCGVQIGSKKCYRVAVRLKRADKSGDHKVEDHRGDHRECDAPKNPPPPCAVHARRIVVILIDRG